MKGIQARAVQDTVAARASLIRKLQLWLFALVLSAPLLVPTSVTLASGYEAIGGVAYTSEVKTYGYPRYVTNPASRDLKLRSIGTGEPRLDCGWVHGHVLDIQDQSMLSRGRLGVP